MDEEFDCFREALLILTPPIDLNVTSELEHVPKIERSIRVTKERFRDNYESASKFWGPLVRVRLTIPDLSDF